MSVHPVSYFVKNPDTGRKIKKTKFRVQIRTKDVKVSKLFNLEQDAIQYEKKCLENKALSVVNGLIDEVEAVDVRLLLKSHFNETLSKQAESSFKTNQNRCLSAIPNFKIPYKLISARIDKYKYSKALIDKMLNRQFDFKNEGIEFGQFFVNTIDFHLMMAYVQARKDSGIADNTILRELSTISGAFERIYKYFPKEFPDSILNPVKMIPKAEKPKPYHGRKRVLNDSEALAIAQWLKMKANQEPFYVFVQCLYTGARKSEVLRINWENVNMEKGTIFLPKTKNGKSRTIDIEDSFKEYLMENRQKSGKVFNLTGWNFRQYWVDALRALGMYDVEDRLHFHDTRRTSISRNIKAMGSSSFQLAKVFGTTPQAIETAKSEIDQLPNIFAKLKNGEKLTEAEIMKLAGHSSINTTQIYNSDRD